MGRGGHGVMRFHPGRRSLPARVVWGATDRFQKLHYGERLAADLHAPLVRLDTARHFVPEDHPEPVADAVGQVLAAAASAS